MYTLVNRDTAEPEGDIEADLAQSDFAAALGYRPTRQSTAPSTNGVALAGAGSAGHGQPESEGPRYDLDS